MCHLRNPRRGWNYTACARAERLWRLYYRLFCKYMPWVQFCAAVSSAAERRPSDPAEQTPPSSCIIKVWLQKNPVIRRSCDGRFCSAVLCRTSCPPLVDVCEADRPPVGGGVGLRLIIITFILDRLIVLGLCHVKINFGGGGFPTQRKENRVISQ